MLLAHTDGDLALLLVGADLLDVTQRAAGHDEGAAFKAGIVQLLGSAREAVAVHGHQGQPVFFDLKERAGIDGAHLVGGDGEDGLVDHVLQHVLGQAYGVDGIETRQLRVILRADAEDVELALAALDGDIVLFVCGDGDDPVGQAADHLAEEARAYDDDAALGDIGLNAGYDALLEIVALDVEFILATDLQALQRRDRALGGRSAGGDVAGSLQQIFFTAEFHMGSLRLKKSSCKKER